MPRTPDLSDMDEPDADQASRRATAILAASPPGPRSGRPADGSIQIMPDSRIVTAAGEQIALTRMEFDLLVFLAEHPRRVFFRSQLLQRVWGYKVTGERTVDVHVGRLRVKLGDSFVTTVRDVGCRLADGARVRILSSYTTREQESIVDAAITTLRPDRLVDPLLGDRPD
jgi:DNA-binding winged helix-turn-helix (wHTH) protein